MDDLCALGYRVTILFTRHDKRVPLAESGTFRGLAGQYGKRGITLSGLPGGGQQDGGSGGGRRGDGRRSARGPRAGGVRG